MKKTQTGTRPGKTLAMLACAGLLVLLTGCGGGEESGSGSGAGPDPEPEQPPVSGDLDADTVNLAHSALDVTSKLVMVANIVNTMLREHIDLVDSADVDPRNILQCADSPQGYNFGSNQINYFYVNSGFGWLPAGPSLHVALSECTIEGLTITGAIDIANIRVSGNPAGNGDWEVEAEVWLSPVQIHNDNGTETSLTDNYIHTVDHQLNVLSTRIEIAADPDAGLIGGLNGQHYAAPFTSDAAAINFQFRPFRIDTVEDSNTAEYRVEVTNHAEGPSMLSRYTNGGDDEVLLRIRTQANAPLLWVSGRPASYAEPPASGELAIEETCGGCATMQASVVDDGIVLTVDHGDSVASGTLDWSLLLSPLPAP